MLPPFFPDVPPVTCVPLFKVSWVSLSIYTFPPRLFDASPLLMVAFPAAILPFDMYIFPPQPTLFVPPVPVAFPSMTLPPVIFISPLDK